MNIATYIYHFPYIKASWTDFFDFKKAITNTVTSDKKFSIGQMDWYADESLIFLNCVIDLLNISWRKKSNYIQFILNPPYVAKDAPN